MEFHKIGLSTLALAAFTPFLNAQDQRPTPQTLQLPQRRAPVEPYQNPNGLDIQPKLMWPLLKIAPMEPYRVFEIPNSKSGKPRLLPYVPIKPFQGPQWPYLKGAPPHTGFRLVSKPRK